MRISCLKSLNDLVNPSGMKYFLCTMILFSSMWLTAQQQGPLLRKVSPGRSGVQFVNTIEENDSLHIFKYEYLYNGHGIGTADFNKDGLEDIFISGNVVPNKLYLNKGELKFEDVTANAGVVGNGYWRTGVSVADVNGDSWPDIYICHSGPKQGKALSNELYIHQGIQRGVPVFKEMAEVYGLDAPGTLSTHAAFFDYDLDGDLDMFLVNHSNHTFNPYLNTARTRATPDMRYGNRLFRNNRHTDGTSRFEDVTLAAGVINNALNFGLSVVISDLNRDGWPDIYSSSDYTEQDFCYINNRNGTFRQTLQSSFTHISKFSMGADISDVNNDGWPDVFTLDMLPEDNYRQKLLKGPDEYDAYHLLLDSGYYHQQMRNMLHLNMGEDPSGTLRFSEIGQMAGISNTDWSWSALFADLDNDGWKDLFVTNGYLRDYTDNDFLKYTVADEQLAQAAKGNLNFKTYDLVKKMPANKLTNYVFKNDGGLTFSNKTAAWGITETTVSNCAAYADLDNDGDLDLIVGNNNEPVQLYENVLPPGKKFLQVQLKGHAANSAAIGAKVFVATGGKWQFQELYPVRGYQSSVSTILHFGLGDSEMVDSIRVEWPGGDVKLLSGISANQRVIITHESGTIMKVRNDPVKPLVKDITRQSSLDHIHRENDFVDFKVEVLLPYQLSRMGPALATADVDENGLDDIYIGGAIGQAGVLYLQQKNGSFVPAGLQSWEADKESEDIRALFVDLNNDKHPDLYVVSGGNEYEDGSPEYADRIYINDGKGNFSRLSEGLPIMTSSKSCVAAGDIDGDGDNDLFVGGTAVPGSFPHAARSYLLRNDSKPGKIMFTDVTVSWNKLLEKPGMITSAQFADMNGDQRADLILAGEWMSLKLFLNKGNSFEDGSSAAGLNANGLWSALYVGDVNNDGQPDIIAGNAGENLPFKASEKEPVTLHCSDIDDNGVEEVLFCYYIMGKLYPAASRDELLDQVVPLRKKFVKYHQYANARIEDIIPESKRNTAATFKVTQLSSIVYLNNGKGAFNARVLPREAQVSRVYSVTKLREIFLLAGNFYPWRVQWGRSDAGLGSLLRFDGKGEARVLPNMENGIYIDGDIRQISTIRLANGNTGLVVLRNNEKAQLLEWQK